MKSRLVPAPPVHPRPSTRDGSRPGTRQSVVARPPTADTAASAARGAATALGALRRQGSSVAQGRPQSTPAAAKRSGSGARPRRRGTLQMDEDPLQYWNAQAKNYDDNIFSTIDEDTTGIITRTIERFGCVDGEGPSGRCVDLGCGAGKYLPTLSANFHTVKAYDLSPKLVEVARKEAKTKNLQNVEVQAKDLAKIWYRDDSLNKTEDMQELEMFGFGVMTNVLISPGSEYLRMAMLRNAERCLCSGGHLLVIVPSLESALYVNMRRVETRFENDQLGKLRGSDPWPQPSQAEGAELLQGVVKRAGVRTKHFLEPEFRLLASRAGFLVEACERVTFTWKAELNCDRDSEVPAALHGTPLPWDWMFVLKKLAPENSATKQQEARRMTDSASVPPVNSAGHNTSTLPAVIP